MATTPTAFAIKKIDHTGITVTSLRDALTFWVDRVKQSGWNPVGTPQTVVEGDRSGVRLAYVRGPDGITLEFIQLPPTAPRES